jgi:hypothetical protein
LGKRIGGTRADVLETTLRDEAETDLFGEQAVLCGDTSALIRAGFDTLVGAGYPPELAYFECPHELKFIVDLIHEAGLSGIRKLISETAKWGELTVGPQIIDQSVQTCMRSALKKIRSGKFAREFISEMKTGQRRYMKLLREAEKHPIEKVGARLRGLMAWRKCSVTLALPSGSAPKAAKPSRVCYLPGRWPKIVIGLAVVGIAASRSQGCGIAELPVTTRHIFLTALGAACCLAGSATLLLGSAANADVQNASASPTLAHWTDQPHTRLSLLTVFIPGL